MCKPLYTQITRNIPLNVKRTLVNISKNDYLELEQQLLEYCKEPRTINEIKEYMPLDTTIRSITRHLIKPLIDSGKIKHTIPDDINALHQMYLTEGVERTPEIEEILKQKCKSKLNKELREKLLEFCKEPRSMKEIAEHLGQRHTTYIGKALTRPLIAEGKLKLRFPHDPCYSNQQYVVAESLISIFTEESIVEYCREPRRKQEIVEHFNLTLSLKRSLLKKLIEKGKICYTEESLKLHEFNAQRRLKSNG